MSGPGLIEVEAKGLCQLCLARSETRPYGPNGEEICFECGVKNPLQSEKRMGQYLMGDPQ